MIAPPQLGRNWCDHAKMILAAEHDPHLVGYSGQFKQYEGLVCNMMEFILGNGGALWDEERRSACCNRPRQSGGPLRARPHRRRDLATGRAGVRRAGIHRAIYPGTRDLSSQLALRLADRQRSQQSKVAGKIGMMPLPAFPGGRGAATLGGWQMAISRFSKNPRWRGALCAFMTSHEMQKTHRSCHRPGPRAQGALRRHRTAREDSATQIVARNLQASGAPTDDSRLCAAVEHHATLFQRRIGAAR